MKKTIIIMSVLAIVASCKMGKNYKGSEVIYPEQYRYGDNALGLQIDTLNTDTLKADSLINLDWFALFNDPVLDSLVRKSLTYNYDLKIALENVLQAQYNIGVKRADMLPSIGIEAGASRGNFQQVVLESPGNLFYGAGAVNWEIDFWGKYRRLTEAAKAEYLASEQGYRASQITLMTTVASLYFQLLEYHAQLKISQQTYELRNGMVQIINERFEYGYVPEIDLNQAQIQLAIAASTIPIWERSIAQTEHFISVLTGVVPQEVNVGIDLLARDTTISIPQGLPSDLLTRRPDILVAEQDIIAQNALAGAAQANRLPNISLTGLLGVASDELSNLSISSPIWNVGGALFGPIFYWGKYRRLADIESSKREQAIYAYQRTVLDAFREVEDVLIEISSLKKELIARQQHVDAASNAQILSQERYNQGVTSYLEYLESQRQAFEASQNLVRTKQQLLSAHARLYKALGGGWVIN
jgi:multidrug efflux system outer membrane protein